MQPTNDGQARGTSEYLTSPHLLAYHFRSRHTIRRQSRFRKAFRESVGCPCRASYPGLQFTDNILSSLFLNIVAPPSFPMKKGFPVRVYIHGGSMRAFYTLAGSSDFSDVVFCSSAPRTLWVRRRNMSLPRAQRSGSILDIESQLSGSWLVTSRGYPAIMASRTNGSRWSGSRLILMRLEVWPQFGGEVCWLRVICARKS